MGKLGRQMPLGQLAQSRWAAGRVPRPVQTRLELGLVQMRLALEQVQRRLALEPVRRKLVLEPVRRKLAPALGRC